MSHFEHDKLAEVQPRSQAIGELPEWLRDQGLTRIARSQIDGEPRPVVRRYQYQKRRNVMTENPDGLSHAEALKRLGQVLVSTAADADPPAGRWPAEPPVGSVLRFEREYGRPGRGGLYTYVALRTSAASRPWYVTGSVGRDRMDWADLRAMIGDTAGCEIAVSWHEIPALPETEAAEGMDAQDYVSRYFGRAEPEPPPATP